METPERKAHCSSILTYQMQYVQGQKIFDLFVSFSQITIVRFGSKSLQLFRKVSYPFVGNSQLQDEKLNFQCG